MKQSGANYAYLGNTAGSNISVLKACETAGVKVQFLGNVWGMGEEAMKAAGSAANGVVFPVRTAVTWDGNAPGLATFKDISKMSDPSGNTYRTVHYMAAVCTVMYMKEAMDWADKNGGVTGVKIRDGMYQKTDWVPKGTEGVCNPSTWTTSDHRPHHHRRPLSLGGDRPDRWLAGGSCEERRHQDGEGRHHQAAPQDRPAGLVSPARSPIRSPSRPSPACG